MANESGRPKRGTLHDELARLVGTWSLSGVAGAGASGKPMTEVDTFHWLAGDFFLHQKFVQTIAGNVHEGICVFGVNPENEKAFLRMFDNLGYAREYELSGTGGTWKISGPFERATLQLSSGDERLSVRWEQSTDGGTWTQLCSLEGKRA